MSITSKYDYVIIGAGCAGLSLAYRMLNKDYKVCVIELESNINKKISFGHFGIHIKIRLIILLKKNGQNG